MQIRVFDHAVVRALSNEVIKIRFPIFQIVVGDADSNLQLFVIKI